MSKTPPHNIDAEKSLLGAMILSEEAVSSALDQVTQDDFYKPKNGLIFQHIKDLYSNGERIDALTLADSLERSGDLEHVGGAAELISIQTATPAISNAGAYAKIVKDMATLRRLITVARDLSEMGYNADHDIDQTLVNAEAAIFEVTSRGTTTEADSSSIVGATLDMMTASWLDPSGIVGVPSGFSEIDKKLSGLRRSGLIVLGARPAMGKSALAANIACNVAIDQKLPVLYFNLEMNDEEVMQRMLAYRARTQLSSPEGKIKLSPGEWVKLKDASVELAEAPLVVDSDSSVTVLDIYSRCRKAHAHYGQLGLVVVDYLQLMVGKGENRQLEIAEISRKLKLLAKELDVPVLALSQLHRGVESRAEKIPQLSDLRESGAIEQDADVVSFLYREELYVPESKQPGVVDFIIAKHRQGTLGTIKMAYLGQQTRFASLAKQT